MWEHEQADLQSSHRLSEVVNVKNGDGALLVAGDKLACKGTLLWLTPWQWNHPLY